MTDLFDSPDGGSDSSSSGDDLRDRLGADIAAAGGEIAPEPEFAGQIGVTTPVSGSSYQPP